MSVCSVINNFSKPIRIISNSLSSSHGNELYYNLIKCPKETIFRVSKETKVSKRVVVKDKSANGRSENEPVEITDCILK